MDKSTFQAPSISSGEAAVHPSEGRAQREKRPHARTQLENA